jgi:putative transposase
MQAALQKERRGRRPHQEDPRGSPQEPRDLRLPAGARRAARHGRAVRSAQGCPANEGRGASGLHARQEAWKHPPRPKGCSRTGPPWQGLRGHSAQSRIWLADLTYVPTQEGFLYLAFILDTHSRRIVGWSMASHMRTELVVDALQMAVWRRKPSAGLVHHSDRGAQCTRRSRSASASKRSASFLRWEGPEPLWTERDGREFHRHPQDRTPRASAPLS